jgi:NADPH-dependent curcumin reductase CurA
MRKMLANIIIMVLILGYCAFLIYKSIKNSKEGKHMGCSGCSGNCGSCCGCSGAAFKGNVQTTGKKKQLR